MFSRAVLTVASWCKHDFPATSHLSSKFRSQASHTPRSGLWAKLGTLVSLKFPTEPVVPRRLHGSSDASQGSRRGEEVLPGWVSVPGQPSNQHKLAGQQSNLISHRSRGQRSKIKVSHTATHPPMAPGVPQLVVVHGQCLSLSSYGLPLCVSLIFPSFSV